MNWLEKKDAFINTFKPDNKPLSFNEISSKLNASIGDDNELTKLRDELKQDKYLALDNLFNTYKLTPLGLRFIGFVKNNKKEKSKRIIKFIIGLIVGIGGLVVGVLQLFS